MYVCEDVQILSQEVYSSLGAAHATAAGAINSTVVMLKIKCTHK
jgi:hypothetical protein